MPVVALFILLAAVVGSSTLVFALTYLFMRDRRDRLEGGVGGTAQALEEQIPRLPDDLDSAHSQIEGLRERMDFTERLLGDGRDSAKGSADDTP